VNNNSRYLEVNVERISGHERLSQFASI